LRAAVTQPKENAAPLRGRRKPLTQYWNLLLVFAVVLGVMPACFGVVMLGMARMAMGAVRVMRRLLVIALFVGLRGDDAPRARDARLPCGNAQRLRGRS
jgi:hypothetical protein